MNRLVKGIACLLLVAISLVAAHARASEAQRPSKWWHDPECKAKVGLTERQTAEIDRIFLSVRDELRAEKAELEKQEAALSRLLAESSDNEAIVVRTIDRAVSRGALHRNTAARKKSQAARVVAGEPG